MRTETKLMQIFNFNELEKSIQETLIEKEKYANYELYAETELYDEIVTKAKKLLKKYFRNKAVFKNTYYDFSYCQGGGAMIEFDLLYYNSYIKIRHYGRYYHERSFEIFPDYLLPYERYEKLKDKIIEINRELASYGYNLLENCTNDEFAIENLMEYEFLKDGTMYI